MKRSSLGKHRASRKKLRKRQLAVEALEPKRVLDASFGFVSTPGGFAFQITGTDFAYNRNNDGFTPDDSGETYSEPDNIVLWTSTGALGGASEVKFFVEWVDDGGSWHSLSGGVSAGDIADEAQDRSLQPGDFKGFLIKALGGQDTISLNGNPTGATLPAGFAPPPTDTIRAATVLDPLGFAAIGIRTGSAITATAISEAFTGQRASIEGNGGGDFIYASPEDDTVDGGPGKDIIVGGAGNDTLTGGPDNDQINGGSGKDEIDGGDGRDLLWGGDGADTIKGGAGDDGLQTCSWNYKDPGNTDELGDIGGSLPMVVGFGLYGGAGNDELYGEEGCDDLDGGAGNDVLDGGAGDDSLLGDNHDKTPSGGSGTDAWQAGPTTSGTDRIKMTVNDIEKVDTTGNPVGEPTFKYSKYEPSDSAGRDYTVLGFNGDGGFQPGPFATPAGPFTLEDWIDLSGWNGNGTSGVQIVTGGGKDRLAGSDNGDDILQAGPDDDTLVGGAGDDYLGGDANTVPSDDSLISDRDAGYEADRATTGNPIYGVQGNDLMSGGDGGDIIDGFDPDGPDFGVTDPYAWTVDAAGGDTLTYGKVTMDIDGNKEFAGSPEAVEVSLEGFLDFWNTTGNRTADNKVGDNGPDWGRGGHAKNDIILNSDGSKLDWNGDYRDYGRRADSNSSVENLIGSEFDDIFYFDIDNNGGNGAGGNDEMYGLEGNDLLDGGDGDDKVDGDYAEGKTHEFVTIPSGDFGNDNLLGGKGKDTLYGRDGFDQLSGNNDEDTLIGGKDVDAMSGGKGEDRLVAEYDTGYTLPSNVASDYVLDGTRFIYDGGEIETLHNGLVDLNFVRETDSLGDLLDVDPAFEGYLFGGEDNDIFDVDGADTVTAQNRVRSELNHASSEGRSDFDIHNDPLNFI